MKKLHIIMVMSALTAISCSPAQDEDIFDIPQTGYTLFEGDFEAVSFGGASAAGVWDKGDCIGVFGSDKGENERFVLKKAYDGKAAGEFYGTEVSGESIAAYFPYSESYALYDGEMMYALTPGQEYDADETVLGHFEKYAGYAYAFSSTDNVLEFRYASGLLIIKVRTFDPINVLSVKLISDTCPLAGVGKVAEDLTVTLPETASGKLVLDCGEDGVPSRTGDAYTEFPIVMPAGSYDKVNLEVLLKDGSVMNGRLDSFEIKRITSWDFSVMEISVSVDGIEGFKVSTGLEFEPQL